MCYYTIKWVRRRQLTEDNTALSYIVPHEMTETYADFAIA